MIRKSFCEFFHLPISQRKGKGRDRAALPEKGVFRGLVGHRSDRDAAARRVSYCTCEVPPSPPCGNLEAADRRHSNSTTTYSLSLSLSRKSYVLATIHIHEGLKGGSTQHAQWPCWVGSCPDPTILWCLKSLAVLMPTSGGPPSVTAQPDSSWPLGRPRRPGGSWTRASPCSSAIETPSKRGMVLRATSLSMERSWIGPRESILIKAVSANSPSTKTRLIRPEPNTRSEHIINHLATTLPPTLSFLTIFPMASSSSSSGSDLSTPRSVSPSSTGSRSSATTTNKRMSLSSRRISSPYNPMAGVDVEALEDQMRVAALDGLRGYAQDHYGTVTQYHTTQYITKNMAAGYQVLREPAWNKGWPCHISNVRAVLTYSQVPHLALMSEFPKTSLASCLMS
jgi:hypothetical protein